MRIPTTNLGRALGSGALAACIAVSAHAADPSEANQLIQDWPEISRNVAQEMMDKYGQPDEAAASRLIWHDNGPWLRTIVYRDPVDHHFPMPHQDVLEQAIPYDVPVDMFDDLAAYDGSVIAERTKGEIAARCDKEEANFLALNLANDIIEGERTVEEARAFYADAIQQMMEGNPPEYMRSLAFDVPRGYEGDPDVAVIGETAEQ